MTSLMTPPPSSSPTAPEGKPSQPATAQQPQQNAKRRLHDDDLDAPDEPTPKRHQTNPQQAAKTLSRAAATAAAAAPYEIITWQSSTVPHLDPEATQPAYGTPQYPNHFVDPRYAPWMIPYGSQIPFAPPTAPQKSNYHVPSLATTFVESPTPPYQSTLAGSASHPIVLDDSAPLTTTVRPLAPTIATNSQPPYLPTSTFYDKENTDHANFKAYPPPASQQATVGKQPSIESLCNPPRNVPMAPPPPKSDISKPYMRTSSGKQWAVGLMGKMGYVPGRGLGVDSQGRYYPVELSPRPDPHMHLGLGVYAEMSTQQRLDEIRQTMLKGGDPQYLKPTQPIINIDDGASNPRAAAGASKHTPQPPSSDEPALCPEQAALVDLILKGNNVFYTGSAGCGKSTVLKAFVKQLRAMGRKVRIVAPTGRAALNVGGSTTWTFAGFTPDSHKLPLRKLIEKAMYGRISRTRLQETDVLVIDEVSMVENLHFERLNQVMKAARTLPHTTPQPFGGCQIVVTGDFCQLPPVKPFQHCIECGKDLVEKTMAGGMLVYECRTHGAYPDEDKWAFRSKAWEECGFVHVHLKTIHRQNDQTFIRMLQRCRLGEALEESEIQLLLNHKCRVAQATKLFCTKREAETVNKAAFDKLVGMTYSYWAHDRLRLQPDHSHLSSRGQRNPWRNTWGVPPPSGKLPLKCFDEHRFGECVQLKKGMLVVLLANLSLESGLCNGSQGTVCGFEDYDPEMMPMRDMRESTSFSGKKSIESVALKEGQRGLRGEHAALMESEIKAFVTSGSAPIKKWPVVRFHNGITRTVYAECSVSTLGDNEPFSTICRTQIPLAPAWAMTVHKSQSLTLDRVIVNLDRAFEEGQVYVALSRATGLEGLKIEGNGTFLRDKLMVNSEVAAFLRERFGDIYKATEAENAVPEKSS